MSVTSKTAKLTLAGIDGPQTMTDLRRKVRMGITFLESWRRDGRADQLAAFEIVRAQTWQWLYHGVVLDWDDPEGSYHVSRDLVGRVFDEELARLLPEVPDDVAAARLATAAREARALFTETEYRPFPPSTAPVLGDDVLGLAA